MKTGPKYKIARRLGAPIFEKTQTAKFEKSKERRQKSFGKAKSAFGTQMNEKQKARLTYGVSERQFKNYVKGILESKSTNQNDKLFEVLESRLDNAVMRAGFAATRRHARQVVSHGHIVVNGTKTTIPSYKLRVGDVFKPRGGSLTGKLFANIDEKIKDVTAPNWLDLDKKTKEVKVVGAPKTDPRELMFDISAIFEYYKR